MSDDTLRKVMHTANEPNTGLEVVSEDLYMTSESRPTEHVYRFTDEADGAFRDYVLSLLRDTEHTVETDGDELHIKVSN